MNKPIIGISIGEIHGIGPEVVIKTFSDQRMFDYCTPIVYCCKNLIVQTVQMLNIAEVGFELMKNPKQLNPRKLNLFCNWQDESELHLELGNPTPQSGKYALKSLQAVMFALKSKLVKAIVTAPIDKLNIQSGEFNFHGHSEYLMTESGASSFLMLMVSNEIKVGLVTSHIPLKDVSQTITKSMIVEKITILHKSLEKDFSIQKPKIAVLGINPHAGDKGLLGSEEQEIILPAIKEVNEKGILAYGPYPADGFFGSHVFSKYDGVLAMYHDQGLIPFKNISFESGVNFTAGLPIVRTSPAHGTGYDIAGKGIADESSFREAVFMALKILRNQAIYSEIHSNPLQTKLVREKEES